MGILRLEKPDAEDAWTPGGQEAEEAEALMGPGRWRVSVWKGGVLQVDPRARAE